MNTQTSCPVNEVGVGRGACLPETTERAIAPGTETSNLSPS
ncbi:MAG: hypothetical protein VKL39_05790 [Leptolyngbyaceae bacterium]|nr:hypothetical protein [Leptolyngbyaceae bacterium]